MKMSLTRDVPLNPGKSALLVVDVQKYVANSEGLLGINSKPEKTTYLLNRINSILIPNIQKILKACRSNRGNIEVIYTYVECLTKDCRDQSLDYKLSGFKIPKGSPDAEMLPGVEPEEDEILIPKTSCSVFNSTNIEYVLRNLGVTQLMVVGMLSNQCVESAVRDAADRGFLVTLVEDAIAAYSDQEHQAALHNLKGFSRIVSHDKVVDEIQKWNN